MHQLGYDGAVSESVSVVIIGAGQAGLATSRELGVRGIEHLVLERGKVAQTWRDHWDSFRLVTPNWSIQLPGGAYAGPDPDGFMPRDEVVAHLSRYAAETGAPVREGIDVTGLERDPDGGFRLHTSDGELRAARVVVASGAYQRPHRPPAAAALPADLLAIDAADYSNPAALPPGPILVVGSGQTGCQIAEELHLAGRTVFLACGRAPWCPRRLHGHDIFWWVLEAGFLDAPVESLPDARARLAANVQSSGHQGGHDVHYRVLRALGVNLLGRFAGVDGRRARFAADLGDSVAWGDARRAQIMGLIRGLCERRGLGDPGIPEVEPFDGSAPEELDLTGFGAVVFTGGFRPDYSWIDVPELVDELGFPRHAGGASTAAPGLYFVGVHFLRKRKSSLLCGVGEDATMIADAIAAAAG